jgi:hypothetical protein
MHKIISATIAAAALALAFGYAGTAAAAADPTVAQVYEAAESGHMDQAQQMMDQVLIDHPKSGTAHYVQAELYARQGKFPLARSELATAEALEPGLPHIGPQSVQSLKAELGLTARAGAGAGGAPAMRMAPPARPFPWGLLLIFAAVIGILLMVFRRRAAYVPYPAAGGPYAAGGAGPYGPGPGYGPAPMGGGMGSGIVGGLASGLAVGAGVVAGEELAHHFMDGNRQAGVLPPAGDAQQLDNTNSNPNGDMGGQDFGVNDPGSWDDGGSFGGGGGDGGGGDWS